MTIRIAPSPARSRQQQAHHRVRREILLAAAEVFARRGYAAATLADLAEAAGYAPSLYRYFKSKEELFSSLTELLKGELNATFDRPVERGQPLPARLEALLRSQFELMRERRQLFAVLLADGPAADPGQATAAHPLRAGMALYEAQLAGWLRRHVARRELRCPFELAARALTGVSHAFHSCHVDGRDDTPPAEQARLVVDLALHGLQGAGPA